jgi:Pyruvate/2-oxoacid:ferredoxin oxidoreductase gamma subunit
VTDRALLSLLIPAVGGQGGGVLLEWIVDAATADGYSVHGTSIPGVAQRTGSTSYYVELATERGEDDAPPIFSLYPVPGALDVLLAPEFLEVGRSIELGFPSPARTTIVASTHRLYSIHEKIVTGLGIYPIERLHEAARAFSRSLVAFDALALAREHRTEANAVLLGALARLGPFVQRGDLELARIVARHLAVWMSYEDAIRVAQLKTRVSRFERIAREKGADGGEIVVTDFLKPDLDEIYGVLPYRLVAPFARWAERRWPHGRPALGQHVKTTTISGYLRVWALTLLRPLRPISYRARDEHARMDRWLAAVERCAALDAELAREIARAAQLVKGYGDVRRRMVGHFDRLVETVMRMTDRPAATGGGFEAPRRLASRYRALVLQGPDSEAEAVALAADALARL